MKTDRKGFIVSQSSPHREPPRLFVAVRAPELKALEASPNRSLRKLAQRFREAIASNDRWWAEKIEKDERLRKLLDDERAKREADPKLKAAYEKQQEELLRGMAGFLR